MEDARVSPSVLASYSSGMIVWAKLPSFWWWPAKVVDQITTEGNVTKLQIKTYGDDEGYCINSPKMIKPYACSERRELIEKAKKKYKNSSYCKLFGTAIDVVNKEAGITEVTDSAEQNSRPHSPQAEKFEIKKRSISSDSNSASHDYSSRKDFTPTCIVDKYPSSHKYSSLSPQSFDSSTSGSVKKCNDISSERLLATPTRTETPNRSIKRSAKRSQTNSMRKENTKAKKMKQSGNGEDGDHESFCVINNGIDDNQQVTPGNSTSESESDDLPAISISQTPTKGYSSLKDVKSKELVWVKHSKDPFWPALVMKDGTTQRVTVNFFAYDGPEYTVKNKKKILPYFCANKEKFEASNNPALREACSEALYLIRSRDEECYDTATKQYEAIKKRRSLSVVTPCKRLTLAVDESSQSSEDEPVESAFGYDITNISTNVNESTGGNNEDSPRSEIVSQFPKGSPYSFEVLKENFLSFELELYRIFKGEIDSENHRIFCEGTSKERNNIQIQNRCGPLFYLHSDHWNELQDIMVLWVKKWSELENKEVHEVKYVSDVLFPEATVKTIQKIENLGKEEAWKKFLSLDSS